MLACPTNDAFCAANDDPRLDREARQAADIERLSDMRWGQLRNSWNISHKVQGRASSTSVVAWGTYAPTSQEVATFARSCVACERSCSAAVLDQLPVAGHAPCPTTVIALMATVLPAGLRNLTIKINFQKTRALFQLLTRVCPDAAWYVKADTDSFVHLRRLSASLHSLPQSITYVGREMRLFSFKGRQLSYMQGGVYALSQRAARAVSMCRLGSWITCPTRVIADVVNEKSNRKMRNRCFVWNILFNDDLYTGICVKEAGLAGHGGLGLHHHPCMVSHPDGKARSRHSRRACKCPITEHALKKEVGLLRAARANLACLESSG